jgi:hypothetical protein
LQHFAIYEKNNWFPRRSSLYQDSVKFLLPPIVIPPIYTHAPQRFLAQFPNTNPDAEASSSSSLKLSESLWGCQSNPAQRHVLITSGIARLLSKGSSTCNYQGLDIVCTFPASATAIPKPDTTLRVALLNTRNPGMEHRKILGMDKSAPDSEHARDK